MVTAARFRDDWEISAPPTGPQAIADLLPLVFRRYGLTASGVESDVDATVVSIAASRKAAFSTKAVEHLAMHSG